MNRILQLTLILVMFVLVSVTASAQSGTQATVIAVLLNVRESPGTSARILGEYPNGMALNVTGRENQPHNGGVWVYTTPVQGGISGWVLSDFLQFPANFSVSSLPVTWPGATGAQPVVSSQPAAGTSASGLTASTLAALNLRSGPGTNYSVVVMLPYRTSVALTSRTADSTWLMGVANGYTGWLSAQYLRVSGDKNTLPVAGSETSTTTAAAAADAAAAPIVSPYNYVLSGLSGHAREIYLLGQQLGNRRGVFSKVGDSITASTSFLTQVGYGRADLAGHTYLQPVIDFYLQTSARTSNSFANQSLASRNGWTTFDLLDPAKASSQCQGMSPLVCEYTFVKPSVALIMIGSNDMLWGHNPGDFRDKLDNIVWTSIEMGVIPVVSTLPRNYQAGAGWVDQYNAQIVSVARKYDIPLWDYAVPMDGLPNKGISPDGLHPSEGGWNTAIFDDNGLQFGYNMRNLTALVVLDKIWREVLY